MSTYQCLHCEANVSTPEILDGWCENCGKKIPPSMQDEVRRSNKPAVKAPVASDVVGLSPRHILLAAVVFVVAASGAFLLMRMV